MIRRIIFIQLLLISQLSFGQEHVYDYGDVAIPERYLTQFNDTIVAGLITRPNGFQAPEFEYFVLKFDIYGNIFDTIHQTSNLNGTVPFYADASGVYDENTRTHHLPNNVILPDAIKFGLNYFYYDVRDSNFNLISRTKVNSPADSLPVFASNLKIFSDTVLITGSTFPSNNFFIYQFVNGQLTDSLFLDDANYGNQPAQIMKHKGKIYVGETNGIHSLIVLNEDLTPHNILLRSASNTTESIDFYDFISTPNALYGLGTIFISKFGLYKIEDNLNLTKKGDIPLYPLDTNHRRYAMRTPDNWIDFNSPESIFVVSTVDTAMIPAIPSEAIWPIKVFLTDTTGQIHWERLIYDSTAAYAVSTVLATSDGGALIFSSKYDWGEDSNYHLRLSVIKIQGNGDIISEKEYALPNAPQILELYPNPATEQVHFRLPEQQSAYRYQLLNRAGQVVQRGTLSEGETSLEVGHLPAGHYFLNLTQATNARQSWSGVFQKVD
jgi:hypothetical protein